MRAKRCLLIAILSAVLVGIAAPSVGASPLAQAPSSVGVASDSAQRARFEGLSGESGSYLFGVEQMLQDQRGLMWFASVGSLAKYDGYQLTAYRPDPADPDSLPYEFVQAIWEDSDGELWVGSGGGLSRLDQTTGKFTHYYRHGQVQCIREDSSGLLWFGTWRGLFALDRVTGEVVRTYQHDPRAPDDPNRPSGNSIRAIQEDREGHLWLATWNGLDRLDPATGTFVHYRSDRDDPHSLSASAAISLHEGRDGALWIGTYGGGLCRMVAEGEGASEVSFTCYRHDPDDPHSLSDDRVTSILEDSSGRLWIGTATGLNWLVPSTSSGQGPSTGSGQVPSMDSSQARFVRHRHDPSDPYSLGDDVIEALYEDRSGIVWIATAGGVNKYSRRANRFTHYRGLPVVREDTPGRYGLSDSKVQAIAEDTDGSLWAATFGGGLNRLDRESGALAVYKNDPADYTSLMSDDVSAVYMDRAGVMWAGTSNGWLERFDPGTETFEHHRYVGSAAVSEIAEDPWGNFWIGTDGAGLLLLDSATGSLSIYHQYSSRYGSLSHDSIQALHVDRDGVLWVGTVSGGVNVWDEESDGFVQYARDPNDPTTVSHGIVLSFYEDPELYEGAVWVGTGGGGLNRFDHSTGAFTRYSTEEGLADPLVGCIQGDDEGYLWLGTIGGLSRFDPRTETFLNLDERDGVPRGTYADCCRSKSGEMLFAGLSGVIAFDPKEIEPNPHRPPVIITAFDVFNEPIVTYLNPDEHIELAHDDNFVSFEFAALDYTVPDKNQYAYLMEGLDKGWVYAGTRRHAEYPNLPPGEYTFRVKGSNSDGVWNEDGIAVRLTITHPFWQTWWFNAVVSILLATGIFGGYRLRVRSIQRRSRELESQVGERTAELSRTNVLLQQEIAERARAEQALSERAAEAAVAAERSRLARELHDSVTQSLYSSTLLAEAGQRLAGAGDAARAQGYLSRLGEITQQALKEMRMLVYQLRPLALSEVGLVGALQQRLDAVERRAGVDARLQVQGDVDLPARVEEEFYRVAQEALNNALKHATPSMVVVSIRADAGRVELEVRDDGQGFDPAGVGDEGGMGLAGMRERAERLGGTLTIDSTPGGGTTVRISLAEPGVTPGGARPRRQS